MSQPTIRRLEDLQTMVSLCKRRGIVFQSSEIYGGLGSCWDYGPLGAQLKQNVKRAWWNAMTRREDIVGLDAAILMHPMVWKASGHVDGVMFTPRTPGLFQNRGGRDVAAVCTPLPDASSERCQRRSVPGGTALRDRPGGVRTAPTST